MRIPKDNRFGTRVDLESLETSRFIDKLGTSAVGNGRTIF